MIDPTQLPILLKAIDFVFEEGRKILEERRERRKAQENPPKTEIQAQEVAALEVQQKNELKQDLLASKIDEILWKNHEEDIRHLVNVLESHTKNYHILKEQYAKWGSALVPPVIMLQMEEKENSIIETRNQLETVLSKVYQKEIHPAK